MHAHTYICKHTQREKSGKLKQEWHSNQLYLDNVEAQLDNVFGAGAVIPGSHIQLQGLAIRIETDFG